MCYLCHCYDLNGFSSNIIFTWCVETLLAAAFWTQIGKAVIRVSKIIECCLLYPLLLSHWKQPSALFLL